MYAYTQVICLYFIELECWHQIYNYSISLLRKRSQNYNSTQELEISTRLNDLHNDILKRASGYSKKKRENDTLQN